MKLICKTINKKDFCSRCKKIWTGGPDLSLLSLDGFPTDDSKYVPTLKGNEFGITIKNFSDKDLNQVYICSIGKNSCSKNLTIDIFEENKPGGMLYDYNILYLHTQYFKIAVFIIKKKECVVRLPTRQLSIRDQSTHN